MGELAGQSYLEALREWAAGRELEIRTSAATQREPTHVVSVTHKDRLSGVLVQRESSDSIDQAAFYMLNTLRRLGAITDG